MKHMKLKHLAVAIVVCVRLPVNAQDIPALQIGWPDLAPPVATIENPFESLTPEQMNSLRRILRLEARAKREGEATAGDEAASLRAQLTEAGLDVDGLFQARLDIIQAREAAAAAINEDLLNKTIRLPGYVLPLAFKERKAVEFLLVPTVGACIHTPPPPANQVVHVTHPKGVEVTGLFTPVWVQGELRAESSIQDVGYSDGAKAVDVSYRLEASVVEVYQ